MKCIVEVISIGKEYAVVKMQEKTWNLPIDVLPAHSRPGDILQIQTGFCPFKTLAQTE
ncbi:MAG: hypothetical protein ACOYEH_07840 [Caldicoprobacterales bacterium]|jgi:hypothetical protein|nr:hypothetical protein [Clostridiales bacterium]